MTVESSEPMIFRPATAATPEALALREFRKKKTGRYERFLDGAVGFFENGGGVGNVGTILFVAIGMLLGVSGLSVSVDSGSLTVGYQPLALVGAGFLFGVPLLANVLHDLQLKPGSKLYSDFRENVNPQTAEELKGWLDGHGLELSKKRLPGILPHSLQDIGFYMALGEPIPNGEISFSTASGELFRGSFEPLPDGGYALLLTEANRPAERTDHA